MIGVFLRYIQGDPPFLETSVQSCDMARISSVSGNQIASLDAEELGGLIEVHGSLNRAVRRYLRPLTGVPTFQQKLLCDGRLLLGSSWELF